MEIVFAARIMFACGRKLHRNVRETLRAGLLVFMNVVAELGTGSVVLELDPGISPLGLDRG
jgi:hypothetical protein